MVDEKRKRKRKRGKRKKLRYFYLDGKLHKVIYIDRTEDIISAWCFKERKRKLYSWADVKKNMVKAYTVGEVAEMLGRTRQGILQKYADGEVPKPEMTYTMDGTFRPSKYILSEQDVLEMYDYLKTVHKGRPRKDGIAIPMPMPTRAELLKLMEHNVVTYIKSDDGGFIPIWKEEAW